MARTASAPTLRPLTVADLIDETFRLYRADFSLLFGLSAIVWLPASVVSLVLNIAFGVRQLTGADVASPQAAVGLLGPSAVVAAAAGVLALIVYPMLIGALTAAISARYLGQPITMDAAVRRALACYGRVLGAYVVTFLGIVVILLVPVGIILGAVAAPVLVIFGVLATPVAMVALVWLILTWAMVTEVILLEDTSLARAFGRSRALVSGSRLRVFGIILLLALIQVVIVSVPASAVGAVLLAVPAGVGTALAQLTTALFEIALYPVQFGAFVLLYYDLRVRKEGFDLTLAAERLGTA